jgi:hypothetical protein
VRIRPLTSSELVAAWDVPENLGKLIGTDEGRLDLMTEPFTPLKVRQAVLEEVSSFFGDLMNSGEDLVSKDSAVPTTLEAGRLRGLSDSRGPTLQLTTPEEEREIFHDKSDVLRNELLWPLTKEEQSISKATKDDKAPIKTETWDKFLFLGLPEKVKSRKWAVAARTIRPLIARHWRRMQLRKWIRFVRDKGSRLEEVTEMDRDAARDCLMRLHATTFWEWKSGSRPMFWNYPKDQQLTMRDGIILWMKGRIDPWF